MTGLSVDAWLGLAEFLGNKLPRWVLVVSAFCCVDPLIFHQMWCQHDELLYVGRMPPILFLQVLCVLL